MRRRDVLRLLGGAVASLPLKARAQQPDRTYRLGFLMPAGRQTAAVLAFFDELRVNGFIEGQNLTVISDGFAAENGRLAELAWALCGRGGKRAGILSAAAAHARRIAAMADAKVTPGHHLGALQSAARSRGVECI